LSKGTKILMIIPLMALISHVPNLYEVEPQMGPDLFIK
jgi:hypothetical protein